MTTGLSGSPPGGLGRLSVDSPAHGPVEHAGVKAVVAWRRAPRMTVADFRADLAASDGQVRRLPGLLRASRAVTLDSGYRRGEPIYDAVDELWFADEDAARRALVGPEAITVRSGRCADPASVSETLVRDHVVKARPVAPSALKNIEFVTRRPDLSEEEFRRYWREHHGPLAATIGPLDAYVQSHALPAADVGERPAWDGMAITWFADLDAMRASAGDPAYAATRDDETHFLADALELPFIITTERLLLG